MSEKCKEILSFKGKERKDKFLEELENQYQLLMIQNFEIKVRNYARD